MDERQRRRDSLLHTIQKLRGSVSLGTMAIFTGLVAFFSLPWLGVAFHVSSEHSVPDLIDFSAWPSYLFVDVFERYSHPEIYLLSPLYYAILFWPVLWWRTLLGRTQVRPWVRWGLRFAVVAHGLMFMLLCYGAALYFAARS